MILRPSSTRPTARAPGCIASREWIGEANAAPYTIEFSNGVAGNYTIFAVATDDGGATATSAPVHITFVEPTPTPGGAVYLSDLGWSSMVNGYGPAERDMSNGESAAGDGRAITLNGVVYQKGLGMHASSELHYNLNGQYAAFLSDISIDDEAGPNGSVTFEVWADGVKLYDSGLMRGDTETRAVNLDVSGRQQLRLVVTDAGNYYDYDHADWAGARLLVATTAQARAGVTADYLCGYLCGAAGWRLDDPAVFTAALLPQDTAAGSSRGAWPMNRGRPVTSE